MVSRQGRVRESHNLAVGPSLTYLRVRVVEDGVAGVVAAHLDAELHESQRHRVVHLLRVARHAADRGVQHRGVAHPPDLTH